MLSLMKRSFAILGTLFCFHYPAIANETKGVVVTIKPLHSLVSGVIGDTGKAELLVKGYASPHGFQLKPSQVKSLQSASIVFSIHEALETFLQRALSNIPGGVEQSVVVESARMKLLPVREGGPWEGHNHEDHEGEGDKHADSHKDGHAEHKGHDDHKGHAEHKGHDDHEAGDVHVWLTPENATKIVKAVTRDLSKVFPQNRNVYKANARAYIEKLEKLDTELKTRLQDIKPEPFIVFHDAFQYFQATYGLNGVGTISVEPDESPSPKRLAEIRKKLKETNTSCVFKEPQFSDRVIKAVVDQTPAKIGVLDPLGAEIDSGPTMYFQLLRNIANSLHGCLFK